MTEDSKAIRLEIVLEYTTLNSTQLGEFLIATKNLVVRNAIDWAIVNYFEKQTGPYSTGNPLYDPLKALASSYRARFRTQFSEGHNSRDYPSGIDHTNCDDIFRQYLDENILDDWIHRDLPSEALRVETIEEGHSILIALTFAAAAIFLNSPAIDYSMMKDMASHLINNIRGALPHNRPPSTLDRLPEIIDAIRKSRNIKRIRITAGEQSIEIEADYISYQSV